MTFLATIVTAFRLLPYLNNFFNLNNFRNLEYRLPVSGKKEIKREGRERERKRLNQIQIGKFYF